MIDGHLLSPGKCSGLPDLSMVGWAQQGCTPAFCFLLGCTLRPYPTPTAVASQTVAPLPKSDTKPHNKSSVAFFLNTTPHNIIIHQSRKPRWKTVQYTNCAATRMSSCCNPLLHDMQALTASAVSCIDPVVSRLQAASAEVAVAKLLWVCSCFMTLCWVFSLPTSLPRYWGWWRKHLHRDV